MSRQFLPGVDICGEWHPDEDGLLRRSARFEEAGALGLHAHIEAMPFNDRMLADLEWQAECDRMSARAAYDAHLAYVEDFDTNAGKALDALALGLVSVLSKDARPLKRGRAARSPVVPFEAKAAVQAAGAFIAGGDEARMASLRMSVGFAARLHGATRAGHRPDDVRMLTLTYRPGVEWSPLHVKVLCDRLREWHNRRDLKFRYVWVAEIQDGARRADRVGRGAVHYHLLMWVPQGAEHLPMADKRGWWPHGSTRTEKANHATAYVMSYLKKANSKTFKEFPDGCRIYSVGGLDHANRRARRWLRLPAFVQCNSSIHCDWRRVLGGGWSDPDGEIFPSEFRRISVGGIWCLQRVHTHARTIDASGPFSWMSGGLGGVAVAQ